MRAKHSRNGVFVVSTVPLEDGLTVSAVLLEGGLTVSTSLLDDLLCSASSLSESEEVISSIIGLTSLPNRK